MYKKLQKTQAQVECTKHSFVSLFLPIGWLQWEAHRRKYFIYQSVHYLDFLRTTAVEVIGHILPYIAFSIKKNNTYTNEPTRYKTDFPLFPIVYILLLTSIYLLSASSTHTACIMQSGVTWRRSQSAHWNTTRIQDLQDQHPEHDPKQELCAK